MKSEPAAGERTSVSGSIGLRREVKSELKELRLVGDDRSIGLRREVKSELLKRNHCKATCSIGLRREVKSER